MAIEATGTIPGMNKTIELIMHTIGVMIPNGMRGDATISIGKQLMAQGYDISKSAVSPLTQTPEDIAKQLIALGQGLLKAPPVQKVRAEVKPPKAVRAATPGKRPGRPMMTAEQKAAAREERIARKLATSMANNGTDPSYKEPKIPSIHAEG